MKAILDKYADYLRHKYPDWQIEIVERHNNGTAGVWGIIQIDKLKSGVKMLRVRPRYGVDEVEYRGNRWFRTEALITPKQLRHMFGYAPNPRSLDDPFPFPFIEDDDAETQEVNIGEALM
jgi:hypothetical protein